MKDVRGTMLSIGNRVCIQEDIPSKLKLLMKVKFKFKTEVENFGGLVTIK